MDGSLSSSYSSSSSIRYASSMLVSSRAHVLFDLLHVRARVCVCVSERTGGLHCSVLSFHFIFVLFCSLAATAITCNDKTHTKVKTACYFYVYFYMMNSDDTQAQHTARTARAAHSTGTYEEQQEQQERTARRRTTLTITATTRQRRRRRPDSA